MTRPRSSRSNEHEDYLLLLANHAVSRGRGFAIGNQLRFPQGIK